MTVDAKTIKVDLKSVPFHDVILTSSGSSFTSLLRMQMPHVDKDMVGQSNIVSKSMDLSHALSIMLDIIDFQSSFT